MAWLKIQALILVAAMGLAMGTASADAAAQVGIQLNAYGCCCGEPASEDADSSCCAEHGDVACACYVPAGVSSTAMIPERTGLIPRSICLGRLASPDRVPASRTDDPPSRPPIFV